MHYRQSKAPRPVLITKAIAERHAALPMLGMDRKLNPVRLGAYVKMIEAGVMRPVPWARPSGWSTTSPAVTSTTG